MKIAMGVALGIALTLAASYSPSREEDGSAGWYFNQPVVWP